MPRVSEFGKINSGFLKKLALVGRDIGVLALLSASVSSAAIVYDSGIVALSATDPLQQGRLSRNGVLSDWSAPKDFPGVNTAIPYRYQAFLLASIVYPYLQISVDDVSNTAQTFVSAYLNSYSPDNTAPNYGLDTNYIGDEGNSGNLAGNPRAFQVVVPAGNTLVLAVNDTSASGAGVGQPFRLLVEGFTDTNFSDAPEPATFGFVAAALAAGVAVARKRKLIP